MGIEILECAEGAASPSSQGDGPMPPETEDCLASLMLGLIRDGIASGKWLQDPCWVFEEIPGGLLILPSGEPFDSIFAQICQDQHGPKLPVPKDVMCQALGIIQNLTGELPYPCVPGAPVKCSDNPPKAPEGLPLNLTGILDGLLFDATCVLDLYDCYFTEAPLPNPVCQVWGDVWAHLCADGQYSPTTDLCHQLMELIPVLVEGRRAAAEAERDGTRANEAQIVPPQNAQSLESFQGGGKWRVTLQPGGAVNPPTTLQAAADSLPTGGHLGAIFLEFEDKGTLSQPTEYQGTNPAWPAVGNLADDPPPSPEELAEAAEDCYYAVAGVAIAEAAWVSGTLAAGPYAPAAFVIGGIATVWAAWGAQDKCDDWEKLEEDKGHWGGEGRYDNCWGCGGATQWNGEILHAPLLEITTHMEISESFAVEGPTYMNAAPYDGYYAQQAQYREMDRDARSAAWTAHNAFGNQTGNATAEITVSLTIQEFAHEAVMGPVASLVYELGHGDTGPLWYSPTLEAILVECKAVCSDRAVLTISSPGIGVVTPGQPTQIDFAGVKGEGTLNVMGVQLKGFTLDGQMEASGPKLA